MGASRATISTMRLVLVLAAALCVAAADVTRRSKRFRVCRYRARRCHKRVARSRLAKRAKAHSKAAKKAHKKANKHARKAGQWWRFWRRAAHRNKSRKARRKAHKHSKIANKHWRISAKLRAYIRKAHKHCGRRFIYCMRRGRRSRGYYKRRAAARRKFYACRRNKKCWAKWVKAHKKRMARFRKMRAIRRKKLALWRKKRAHYRKLRAIRHARCMKNKHCRARFFARRRARIAPTRSGGLLAGST